VCEDCEKLVARQLARKYSGSEFLMKLLGPHRVRAKWDVDAVLDRTAQRYAAQAEKISKRAVTRARRQSEAGYVVYYVRLGHNHIKIGTTNRLPERMVELRVVNEANLLAVEPGGYPTETRRHEQFRKWRYDRRKEDFSESDALLAHIENVRNLHGEPYALASRIALQPSSSTAQE
jgi:hypothetical protein